MSRLAKTYISLKNSLTSWILTFNLSAYQLQEAIFLCFCLEKTDFWEQYGGTIISFPLHVRTERLIELIGNPKTTFCK